MAVDLHGRALTTLPGVPKGVRVLRCTHNVLTDVAAAPAGLHELHAAYNLLKSCPAHLTALRARAPAAHGPPPRRRASASDR